MIDPRNIPRPAMFPMARPCRLTTKDGGLASPAHSHRAYPDRYGNGATDIVAGHFHNIENWEVKPSAADGHTHLLTSATCGAGI
jgi:hypothetical protein